MRDPCLEEGPPPAVPAFLRGLGHLIGEEGVEDVAAPARDGPLCVYRPGLCGRLSVVDFTINFTNESGSLSQLKQSFALAMLLE